jgi:hypothetical protein
VTTSYSPLNPALFVVCIQPSVWAGKLHILKKSVGKVAVAVRLLTPMHFSIPTLTDEFHEFRSVTKYEYVEQYSLKNYNIYEKIFCIPHNVTT